MGVPGLINAYKTATALSLQVTPVLQKAVEVNYSLDFEYNRMNDIMHILKQFGCTVLKQEAQLFCRIETGIPRNRLQEVCSDLTICTTCMYTNYLLKPCL